MREGKQRAVNGLEEGLLPLDVREREESKGDQERYCLLIDAYGQKRDRE